MAPKTPNASYRREKNIYRSWARVIFSGSPESRTQALWDCYYRSPAAAAVAELLGSHTRVAQDCQVALVLPGEGCVATEPGAAANRKRSRDEAEWAVRHETGRAWHIDGLNRGLAGEFSLLVGVYLSDTVGLDSGGLAVWLGLGRIVALHYRSSTFIKYSLTYGASISEATMRPNPRSGPAPTTSSPRRSPWASLSLIAHLH
jgi:hypothetical protein